MATFEDSVLSWINNTAKAEKKGTSVDPNGDSVYGKKGWTYLNTDTNRATHFHNGNQWVEILSLIKSDVVQGFNTSDQNKLVSAYALNQLYLLVNALDTGEANGLHLPVQNITELKNLDTTSSDTYPDKWMILVEDEGATYRHDRESSATEDLPGIAAPNIGVGRWIKISGGISIPNGGSENQILTKKSAVDGDADWEYFVPIKGTSTITDANNTLTFTISSGVTIIEFKLGASLTQTFIPTLSGWVDGQIYTLRIQKYQESNEIDFGNSPLVHFHDNILPYGVWDTVPVGGYLIMHGFGLPNGSVIFNTAINSGGYESIIHSSEFANDHY